MWWHDPDCGHEWQATPAEREKGQRLRCPTCRTILDSLAYHYPELAAEWAPTNPLSAWQVRPSGQTAFTPQWVCSHNPDHTWVATLGSRAAGSGCPECRETGKSKVELDHHAAAQRLFGRASSGQALTSAAFQRRARWLVDITTVTPDGTPLAVEYDGSYWHADKIDIDTAKSLDLLAAGYRVVRLREHPLPRLRIDDIRYFELVVYASSPRPEETMRLVHRWATSESSTWALAVDAAGEMEA
ncbi:zinc-ribbon domain-containing protein [Angustibacter sp. McL0619]|uniref:zinc-ribbon domain-containing protein n=1 Tax=Angustibacter sp. McL0619 TaxID=3415676 RepID=UPI003CF32D0E